jgi:hypothetical protein
LIVDDRIANCERREKIGENAIFVAGEKEGKGRGKRGEKRREASLKTVSKRERKKRIHFARCNYAFEWIHMKSIERTDTDLEIHCFILSDFLVRASSLIAY